MERHGYTYNEYRIRSTLYHSVITKILNLSPIPTRQNVYLTVKTHSRFKVCISCWPDILHPSNVGKQENGSKILTLH